MSQTNTSHCGPQIFLKNYIGVDLGKVTGISGLKKYRLKECVGKGSGGEVYSALNPKDTTVAIKVIDITNDMGREKFQIETRNKSVLTKKKKECVSVTVSCPLEIFSNNQYGFILMDYYPVSLTKALNHSSFLELISKNKKENIPKFIRWVKEMIKGLKYLHTDLDVAHRDIKPDNFLVNRFYDAPIFTDFDTLCIPKDDKCEISDVSPPYCSPELDKTILSIRKTLLLKTTELAKEVKTGTLDKSQSKEKFQKFKHDVIKIDLDICKRSDWWALCITILYLWFGNDVLDMIDFTNVVDFYIKTSTEGWYDHLQTIITKELYGNGLSKLVTVDEAHIINSIFKNIIRVLRSIGLHNNVQTNINKLIEFAYTLPEPNSKPVEQAGGSNNDYESKYLKYKSKYIALE